MRVVDVRDDGLARVQDVHIRARGGRTAAAHRGRCPGFARFRPGRPVLTSETGAGGDGPVHARRLAVGLHAEIEVQYVAPLGKEVAGVTLLARVLLGDLELDGNVGAAQAPDERGDGRADLEVHWTVLDLEHHIVVELPVERHEV